MTLRGHRCVFTSAVLAAVLAAALAGCATRAPEYGAAPDAATVGAPSPAAYGTRGERPDGGDDAWLAHWLSYEFSVPSDVELAEQLETALRFRQREDFEVALDAHDPGELLEHASLTQIAIDRGIFGLDALFAFGDELFDYEFRPEQGLGNNLAERPAVRAGRSAAPNLRRVHEGEFGGPDSFGCSTCHLKGGPDGAGNTTQNAYLRGDGDSTLSSGERNPPHLLGLGPVQVLAIEMTRELEAARAQALAEARDNGAAVEVALRAKEVDFGVLTAFPDGRVDTARVAGVDPDLVVKPFGWKGHQATLRGMAAESFRIHLGIVSMEQQRRARDGELDHADHGDGPWSDLDRDGVTLEVEDGMLTTMVAYLAQLEAPVVRPPEPPALLDAFARGRTLFGDAGCASCHRPYLVIEDAVLEIRPPGADFADREPIRVDVAHDGDQPKVEPRGLFAKSFNVHLFSDLRRHDMGAELATPSDQNGIPAREFLTRPLWGLAFTAPYLHDGRAPTVDDAIRAHGGEASAARDAYLALDSDGRAAIQIFLLSLTREPELFIP